MTSKGVTNSTPLGKQSSGLRSPVTPCLGLQGVRSGSPRARLCSARERRKQKQWWCGTHRKELPFLSTCRQQTMQNFQRNTCWECTFSSPSDDCLFSYTVLVPRKLSGLFLHFLGPSWPQWDVGILLVLWIILLEPSFRPGSFHWLSSPNLGTLGTLSYLFNDACCGQASSFEMFSTHVRQVK